MFRRLWQTTMIQLARSKDKKWTKFMQSNKMATKLERQYVGGDTPATAIRTADFLLNRRKVRSSLFYLGEYVNTNEKVTENLAAKLAIANFLSKAGLDLHISVDPTQVGAMLDWRQGADNIESIARLVASLPKSADGVHCVMLDMEDFSINEKTIALHDELQQKGLPVALTLQAYLHKTYEDMRKKIHQGAKVRLVKGAFAANSELAFQGQQRIKANYRRLIDLMLAKEAKLTGFYPIFATHDHSLHAYVIERARVNGWRPGSYEFEMLYGARNDVAEHLVSQGERVRLYLPFGKDWWPYAIRRVGENPQSVTLLWRSLFSSSAPLTHQLTHQSRHEDNQPPSDYGEYRF